MRRVLVARIAARARCCSRCRRGAAPTNECKGSTSASASRARGLSCRAAPATGVSTVEYQVTCPEAERRRRPRRDPRRPDARRALPRHARQPGQPGHHDLAERRLWRHYARATADRLPADARLHPDERRRRPLDDRLHARGLKPHPCCGACARCSLKGASKQVTVRCGGGERLSGGRRPSASGHAPAAEPVGAERREVAMRRDGNAVASVRRAPPVPRRHPRRASRCSCSVRGGRVDLHVAARAASRCCSCRPSLVAYVCRAPPAVPLRASRSRTSTCWRASSTARALAAVDRRRCSSCWRSPPPPSRSRARSEHPAHARAGDDRAGHRRVRVDVRRDVQPNRLAGRAERRQPSLLDRLPPKFRVGLVAFSGDAQVVAPVTRDRRARARRALGYLSPQRGTAIGDAVARAAQLARDAVGHAAERRLAAVTSGCGRRGEQRSPWRCSSSRTASRRRAS